MFGGGLSSTYSPKQSFPHHPDSQAQSALLIASPLEPTSVQGFCVRTFGGLLVAEKVECSCSATQTPLQVLLHTCNMSFFCCGSRLWCLRDWCLRDHDHDHEGPTTPPPPPKPRGHGLSSSLGVLHLQRPDSRAAEGVLGRLKRSLK